MTGHAGTTHPLLRLLPLPIFDGYCWCPLCLVKVWLVKRKATPPRTPYTARKRVDPGPPPLAGPMVRRKERKLGLRGGLAGKWTPAFERSE